MSAKIVIAAVCTAAAVVGCSEPPPLQTPTRIDPVAVAKVQSSPSTLRMTQATTWRIYSGQTQFVVMGFGSDGKPVDGMRARINSDAKVPGDTWLSLESLRESGGKMELDLANRVVVDTASADDKKIFHGAMRATAAYTKGRDTLGAEPASAPASGITPQAVVSSKDPSCPVNRVMATVASCSGARPACRNNAGGTLMCDVTSVRCARDANKAVVACAANSKATGGASEVAKNPPKPSAPSAPSASSASKPATSSGSGASTKPSSGSGAKKSSNGNESKADKPEECEGSLEDCEGPDDPDDPKLDPDDPDSETPADLPAGEEPDFAELSEGMPFAGDNVDPDPELLDHAADIGDFAQDVDFESAGSLLHMSALHLTALGARPIPTTSTSASCGRTRVLVCGSTKTSAFCRCVAK